MGRIDEIRARVDQSRPEDRRIYCTNGTYWMLRTVRKNLDGTWCYYQSEDSDDPCTDLCDPGSSGYSDVVDDTSGLAALLAHAPADIPWLLEQIDRLTAERDDKAGA